MEAKNEAVQATREFLGQARELQAGIANKRHRIEMLRNMATSTTGTVSDIYSFIHHFPPLVEPF